MIYVLNEVMDRVELNTNEKPMIRSMRYFANNSYRYEQVNAITVIIIIKIRLKVRRRRQFTLLKLKKFELLALILFSITFFFFTKHVLSRRKGEPKVFPMDKQILYVYIIIIIILISDLRVTFFFKHYIYVRTKSGNIKIYVSFYHVN